MRTRALVSVGYGDQSPPKPSQRAKPRPFGTGTPRARGPSVTGAQRLSVAAEGPP